MIHRANATLLLAISLAATSLVSAFADYDAARKAHSDGDYASALSQSTQDGTARSRYMLGEMYEKGEGGRQNLQEAAKWYLKAAEHGDPEVQAALGFFYQQGSGVARDAGQALAWPQRRPGKGMSMPSTASAISMRTAKG